MWLTAAMRRRLLINAQLAALYYWLGRGAFKIALAGRYNLKTLVQELAPELSTLDSTKRRKPDSHDVDIPRRQSPASPFLINPGEPNTSSTNPLLNFTGSIEVDSETRLLEEFYKDEVIFNEDGSYELVEAVLVDSAMGGGGVQNEIMDPGGGRAVVDFTGEGAVEPTVPGESEDVGYEFDPVPIFVMMGIIITGVSVLTIFLCIRYKVWRLFPCLRNSGRRPSTDSDPRNRSDDKQPGGGCLPHTTDSSCSETEQTPDGKKKGPQRPNALKPTPENPYPALAKTSATTSNPHQQIIGTHQSSAMAGLAQLGTQSMVHGFNGIGAALGSDAAAARTRLDSLPSMQGIGVDGGRAMSMAGSGGKTSSSMGKRGKRKCSNVDSDAKSILSSRSGRSGGSGGSKDGKYHVNTGKPVVDSRMRAKYASQATLSSNTTLLY